MRIMALPRYGSLGASSRIRMIQYAEYLAGVGIQVDYYPLLPDQYLTALYGGAARWRPTLAGYLGRLTHLARTNGYDALWLQQEMFAYMPALFERLIRLTKLPLITDHDDAIWHRYEYHRVKPVRHIFRGKIAAVMAAATCVVAGNAYIAAYARQAGARRVQTLPSVIDLQDYPEPQGLPSQQPVIGWIGSPSTSPYLRAIAEPVAQAAATFGAQCRAIGAKAEDVTDTVFRAAPWCKQRQAADLAALSVGLMPLPDEPFERGKCGYKLIQYMAAGRPVIASPVGANKDIVQHGVTGFLAETPQEWAQALNIILADPSRAEAMGRAGRALIKTHYSVQACGPKLAKIFHSMINAPSAGLEEQTGPKRN